jgi:glutamate/tyrosine decarboxylase-like PLP-dependent enzyme
MIEEIRKLEKVSSVLDPDADERRRLRDKIIEYTETFLEGLPRQRSYVDTIDKGIGISNSPITDEPISLDEALALIKTHVDTPGEMVGPAGNLAYIPLGGLYLSALADFMASISNRYASVFFSAPGATRVERMLLKWIADMIGFPQSTAGDFTSGGSIANLLAIVAAREAHFLKAGNFSKTVVYLTAQTHHSIRKAMRTAGLKECFLRFIPLDSRFRMEVNALEKTIKADKKAGLNPWLIVATAGTTDTGAVDPLEDIADIAAAHRLWLHVDGAYGAAFALCPPGRRKLKGIERSDSMIVNPHKGMFLPLGSGVILVREGKYLLQNNDSDANYLQDKDVLGSPNEVSPADLSLELTRPFRGLRLWLPLKILGVEPFRAALSEKLLLAQYFYKKMQHVDRFEMGPFPDLSIVTFRYIPKRGDVNQFNQQLVHAIQKDGRIFISSTTLGGKFTLRLAVLGFRTHLDTIDQAIEILTEKACSIAEGC